MRKELEELARQYALDQYPDSEPMWQAAAVIDFLEGAEATLNLLAKEMLLRTEEFNVKKS